MWRPENDEEFEDEEGNVFNKKTFDDLKRQGLL
jgi:splicing factor 3A subunit 3